MAQSGEGVDVEGIEDIAGADGKPRKMVPLSALAGERQKASQLQAALDKITADRAAADEAAALKAGEHEKLYGDLKPKFEAAEKRLADLDARETKRLEGVAKRNEGRIAALPEQYRKLAPKGLDADVMSDWLDEAAEAFKVEDVSRGTRRATTTEESIPDECVAHFEKYGKHLGGTVKEWLPVWKASIPKKP